MNDQRFLSSQRGATLIELVVAIVIITAAAGTIVGLLAFMSRSSADAMVQAQTASIANAYLNEILARSFADPDGIPDAGRANADDVDDYPGCLPDTLVRDRYGNAVANLGDYRVAVVITQPGLGAVPAAQTRLVQVTVTSPLGDFTRLGVFKTQHP